MIIFKKIRWKNFLSTGDMFTEINLTESPTTLIVGENGSGKSTMLDALTYVLYSKPFRRINKPQLINTVNNSGMLVEIEFEVGSKGYKIVRGMKPNIFEIYVNGDMLDQDSSVRDSPNPPTGSPSPGPAPRRNSRRTACALPRR